MIPNVVVLKRRALPRGPQEELRLDGQTIEPPVKPDPDDPESFGTVTLTEQDARWVLSGERFMVWTKDGQFVHRFGIEKASKGFLAALGRPEVENISPIELDNDRVEHSNTAAFDPARQTIVTQINQPAPRDRQPAGPYVKAGR